MTAIHRDPGRERKDDADFERPEHAQEEGAEIRRQAGFERAALDERTATVNAYEDSRERPTEEP